MKRTIMTFFINYLNYFETSNGSETNAVKLQKFSWISATLSANKAEKFCLKTNGELVY